MSSTLVWRVSLCVLGLACVIPASPAQAETAALKRDAGLAAGGAIDSRFNSATVRTVTVSDAGLTNMGNWDWFNYGAATTGGGNTLFRFDLSSIPTGSTINLAQLRLYHTVGNGGLGDGDVSMILTHDWMEGTMIGGYPGAAGGASFAHPNGHNTGPLQDASGGTSGPTQTWGPASDSFFSLSVDAGSPIAPLAAPTGTGYHVFDVTSHVQQWVSGTKPNYGWANAAGYWNFHCSEAGTDYQPVLFVDYTLASTIPPAAIGDLAAGSPTAVSITLTWTAPADPDSFCMAYDIRYSTATITDADFASATPATGVPAPATPGTSQSMTVTGLAPATTYYFAIKTSDAALNWSAISNVASGTTAASITFANNTLTYGRPADLGTAIDPAGLNEVAVSYGISKASFQALSPQVVTFDGAPAPQSDPADRDCLL